MAADEKRNYEATVALNVQGTEEDLDEIIREVEGDFRDHHAEVIEIRKMEKRKLAYQPQRYKTDEAYYAVFVFQTDPSYIAEIQRAMKLQDNVILCFIEQIETA